MSRENEERAREIVRSLDRTEAVLCEETRFQLSTCAEHAVREIAAALDEKDKLIEQARADGFNAGYEDVAQLAAEGAFVGLHGQALAEAIRSLRSETGRKDRKEP